MRRDGSVRSPATRTDKAGSVRSQIARTKHIRTLDRLAHVVVIFRHTRNGCLRKTKWISLTNSFRFEAGLVRRSEPPRNPAKTFSMVSAAGAGILEQGRPKPSTRSASEL